MNWTETSGRLILRAVCALVIIASPSFATLAQEGNPSAILFYDAADGEGATATLDSGGNYSYVGALSGFGQWTHVTGTPSGGILFYNASTGEGATARLDGGGNYYYVSYLSGFGGWTHVVSAGQDGLLFYNSANGEGATATLDSGGNYSYVDALSGFGQWTHVTGAPSGGILFYDASTGEGATARLDDAGNYYYVSALSGFGEWTHIAATGPAPQETPAPGSGEPAKLAGITDLHNQARSTLGVLPLAWDAQLAATAQAWADQCQVGSHNPNRSSGYPYYVGENTYWRSPSASPQDAVGFWVGEKQYYDRASNSCVGGECRHYTQVVWSKTTHVGCGIATCAHNLYGTVDWLVCNYGPGGNIAGEYPY